MDASQYKDYILVLLFIKYVSDKYAGQPFAPITIPDGASFKSMVVRAMQRSLRRCAGGSPPRGGRNASISQRNVVARQSR